MMDKDFSERSQKENTLTLVCGADDKFAMPLAVTLFSAVSNLNAVERPDIYILDAGISVKNKLKIQRVMDQTRRTIQLKFLSFDLSRLPNLLETDVISKATYLRILIPKLLPEDVKAAIYLDSDLIVEKDLRVLWDTSFDENLAIGVQDYCFPTLANLTSLLTVNSTRQNAVYCNAGVIVLNIEAWRKQNISEKILSFIQRNSRHDQDGINVVINGSWKVVHPKWNVTLSSLANFGEHLPMKPQDIEATRQELRSDPNVIHFTSRHKPWHHGRGNFEALNSFYYDQRFINRFYFYLGKSKWYSFADFTRRNLYRKAVLFFEYKLPRRLKILKSTKNRFPVK